MEVTLSFLYTLTQDSDYESDEFSQVLYSLNGGAAQLVDQITGNGNGGPDETTGDQSFTAVLGTLAAGSHSLAIGVYNNQKTWSNESTELTIDDVLITGTASPAAAGDQASGDDGSLQGLLDQTASDLDLQVIAGL